MASAAIEWTLLSGPWKDQIPGKKVFYARAVFQTTAGYDRTSLPSVHGAAVGKRPIDVFGAGWIEEIDFVGSGSSANNNETNNPGFGTGNVKLEFLAPTQTVKAYGVGNKYNAGTGAAVNEAELATDTSAAGGYVTVAASFECAVVCGA